jgi:adenylosuccinate lyase
MIDRYPAPYANVVFHPQNRVGKWFALTKMFMRDALHLDTTLDMRTKDRYIDGLDRIDQPTPEAVATREASTHHDVVAFLQLVEERTPVVLKRYLHYGLTSSDLVENQHFGDLREHAGHMAPLLRDLANWLAQYNSTKDYPRAGRTHGQIADITSLGHQFHVHQMVLLRISDAMRKYKEYPIVKSAGPTGTSPFRYTSARSIAQRMAGMGLTVPARGG